MSTPDFFRARLDAMIDMRHPMVVLAGRLPWGRIEAARTPDTPKKPLQATNQAKLSD
jgi:IS5 family transposase